jgi:hypothetical protein
LSLSNKNPLNYQIDINIIKIEFGIIDNYEIFRRTYEQKYENKYAIEKN